MGIYRRTGRYGLLTLSSLPQGRVTSFYSTDLSRYTSFMCHRLKEAGGPVRQILVNDKGVIALSARTLHMAIRRGLPLWSIE